MLIRRSALSGSSHFAESRNRSTTRSRKPTAPGVAAGRVNSSGARGGCDGRPDGVSSFPKLLLPREGAAGEADRGEHAVDKSIEKVRFACHVPIQSHRSNVQGSRDRSDADSFKSLLVGHPQCGLSQLFASPARDAVRPALLAMA